MDYDILYQMFQNERVTMRFTPASGGGFDIHDVQVFDDALKKLERDVLAYCHNIDNHQSHSHELLIIEFAREDYDDTFKKLSQEILQDAYFLLIDAEFDTCRNRIKERTHIASSEPDNHNVSDFAMNTYFKEQHLPKDSAITSHLTTLTNNGSWDDFTQKLEPFIRHILNIPDSDY